MGEYYYLDVLSVLIPILAAVFPIVYKKIGKKEPYSNSAALKFLGKVMAVVIALDTVLFVVLTQFLDFEDPEMFVFDFIVAAIVLTVPYIHLTKGNNEKRTVLHQIGGVAQKLIEFVAVVVGAYFIRLGLYELLDDLDVSPVVAMIVLVALYVLVRLFFGKLNKKKETKARLNELESQGIRFCPDCEGTVKHYERFCPKCHRKM